MIADYSKVQVAEYDLYQPVSGPAKITVRGVDGRTVYVGTIAACPRALLEKIPSFKQATPQPFDEYVTERKTVRRIMLAVPNAMIAKVTRNLHDAGWKVVLSSWDDLDDTVFVAERTD